MSSLPVAAVLPELLSALQHAPQVLLNAPTGAGKSTWLPLQILAEGNIAGRIILLEPRRLAARNVAQRLAELLGEKPGETVGFRMRAETCVGPQTRLEVVTEGILTRMIQRDPELTGVGLVILDEFHERSLQADLALALLLDVQQGLRDDLKLLIMSATLDNDRLQRLLPEAPVVVSEGRAYPVERRFSPLSAHQRFDEAVAVAVAELLRHEQGSMLLFLPGVGEIPARSGTADGARGGGCHSLPAVWRVALKRTAQSDPPGAGREAQSGAGHQYCRDQFDHRGDPPGGRQRPGAGRPL